MKKTLLIIGIMASSISYSQYECDSADMYLEQYYYWVLKNDQHIKKQVKIHDGFMDKCWPSIQKLVESEQTVPKGTIDTLFRYSINLVNNDQNFQADYYYKNAKYWFDKARPFVQKCLGYD